MQNTILKPVKYETKIKGYWKDIDGKIYIDNLEAVKVLNAGHYESEVNRLFLLGELAVFVEGRKTAFIISKDGDIDRLENNIIFDYSLEYWKANEKQLIFNLFEKSNGFTVYNEGNKVKISIWK